MSSCCIPPLEELDRNTLLQLAACPQDRCSNVLAQIAAVLATYQKPTKKMESVLDICNDFAKGEQAVNDVLTDNDARGRAVGVVGCSCCF